MTVLTKEPTQKPPPAPCDAFRQCMVSTKPPNGQNGIATPSPLKKDSQLSTFTPPCVRKTMPASAAVVMPSCTLASLRSKPPPDLRLDGLLLRDLAMLEWVVGSCWWL